jgi:threonine dehydrogenase-like Zn-dependent dehydrogenase
MIHMGTVFVRRPQRIAKLILVHFLSESDIFPTGCFVVKNGYEMLPEVEREGATALVIGCGPVGLCVSYGDSSSVFLALRTVVDVRCWGST